MIKSTTHLLTIDLPHGPADIGAEIEVDIGFEHVPGDPPVINLLVVRPVEPFSGGFAGQEQRWLEAAVEDWLAGDGREVALRQVEIDRDEGEL